MSVVPDENAPRADRLPTATIDRLMVLMTSLPPLPNTLPDPALDAELAEVVNDPQSPLASLSAAVVRDGTVVYHNQFGSRYIHPGDRRNDLPANADTLYRIASISKLLTAIGAMKLVETGKLDLDADFSDALGFALRNPAHPQMPITLRMLLSHTSGLRDAAGYYWDAESRIVLKDVLLPGGKAYGSGKMWEPAYAPGEFFQYANLPWGVIGTGMERVTGRRFDHLMSDLLLRPLGLRGGFHPADFSRQDITNVATLYRKRPAGDNDQKWNPSGPWIVQTDDYISAPPKPRVHADYVPGTNATLIGPQGACRLSVSGLATVARLFLGDGEVDGVRVLLPSTVRMMMSPVWTASGTNGNTGGEFATDPTRFMNCWGLGMQIFTDLSIPPTADKPARGDKLVQHAPYAAAGHCGDAFGLTSLLAIEPRSRSAIIYLVGGLGFDPATTPGTYSAQSRYEERIATALHRQIKA